jgi:small ligand-binding sensory domain FIST
MHFKPQTLQSLKIPNAFPAIDPPELILLLISNQYTANEISTIHSKIYSTIKPQQLIGAVVDNIAKKGFLIHSLKGIGFYSSGGVEHRHKQVGRWHSSSPQHKPNKQIFNTISQSTNAINKNIIPNLDKNLQVGSFITLSDTEPLDLYRYLNLKYPNATKLGLITSKTPFINGKHHTIFYNDIIYESGTVGIAFENSSMMEIKYEGVEAIGGVFEITKCRGNIILEIRGENASKMLVKQVQESTLKSHFKDSADLFVKVIKDGGFNVDNTPKQGEAVFKVTGGDITKGTLAIDTKSDLCVGMKVQFMRQIGSGNMTRTDASGVFRFGVKEKEDYVKKVIHQEHLSENQWIEGMDVDVKSEEGVVVYSNGVLDGFQLMNVPGISVEMVVNK